jgi:hypothetical protein
VARPCGQRFEIAGAREVERDPPTVTRREQTAGPAGRDGAGRRDGEDLRSFAQQLGSVDTEDGTEPGRGDIERVDGCREAALFGVQWKTSPPFTSSA